MTQKITLTSTPQAANTGNGVTFISVNSGKGFRWSTTDSTDASHWEPENLSVPKGWLVYVWGSGEVAVSEVETP